MELRHLLTETYPYMPPKAILSDLTEEDASKTFVNVHSIAEIVAHINFWQSWFLKRCRGEDAPMAAHAADGWPPFVPGTWDSLRDEFLATLEQVATLGDQPADRLNAPVQPPLEFPPMANYLIVDALAHVATHNAHHLGQVILLRQWMGKWPPPGGSFTW